MPDRDALEEAAAVAAEATVEEDMVEVHYHNNRTPMSPGNGPAYSRHLNDKQGFAKMWVYILLSILV